MLSASLNKLDYLCRDSFFTGVNEGTVASARIIKMLNVVNDQLVVDVKGIYSIEKFLVARRLMYWQVYLHKTSVAAEQMLINILERAKKLAQTGQDIFAPEALMYFLKNNITHNAFGDNQNAINLYVTLDDNDIWTCIKTWAQHPDIILATLCEKFMNRKLFKVKVQTEETSEEEITALKAKYASHFGINNADSAYFFGINTVSTDTYSPKDDHINILYKNGEVLDISEASDMLNLQTLTKKVNKHFFYYLKINKA